MAELNIFPLIIHTYWVMREASTNSKDFKSYTPFPLSTILYEVKHNNKKIFFKIGLNDERHRRAIEFRSVYKAYNGIKQLKEHENLHRSPTSVNCTALWSFPPRSSATGEEEVQTSLWQWAHHSLWPHQESGNSIYGPCPEKHSGLLPYAILAVRLRHSRQLHTCKPYCLLLTLAFQILWTVILKRKPHTKRLHHSYSPYTLPTFTI